jgi:hypothetical protein
MNGNDLKPMAPDLEQLLEAERARPDPPMGVQQRIYVRLETGGGGGAGGDSRTGGDGGGASLANSAATSTAGAVGHAGLLQALPLTAAVLVTGGLIAVGVAVTMSAGRDQPAYSVATTQHVQETQPAAPPEAVPTRAPEVTPIEETPSIVEPVDEPSTPVRPSTTRPHRTHAIVPTSEPVPAATPTPTPPVVERNPSLAGEQALLEQARAALAKGASAQSIVALQEHARTYPKGVLIEERDGLWIKALLIAGDKHAARIRAQRFRATYPRSIFLPIVQPALE